MLTTLLGTSCFGLQKIEVRLNEANADILFILNRKYIDLLNCIEKKSSNNELKKFITEFLKEKQNKKGLYI